MGGQDRAGMLHTPSRDSSGLTSTIGGKAKPLKAPKKGPKAELDDEDKAFQEKQKAGM
jgi:hypothetical protein